jgi:hypothetical protein
MNEGRNLIRSKSDGTPSNKAGSGSAGCCHC